jgi:hypothetical protein
MKQGKDGDEENVYGVSSDITSLSRRLQLPVSLSSTIFDQMESWSRRPVSTAPIEFGFFIIGDFFIVVY